MESLQTIADTTTQMDLSGVPEGDAFTAMTEKLRALLDGVRSVLSTLNAKLLDPTSWGNIGTMGESAESNVTVKNLSKGIHSRTAYTDKMYMSIGWHFV